MKAIKILSLTMLITLFAVGYVMAEGKTVQQNEQTTCPVMGGSINQSLYTDYEGKRVYFCCEGCVPEFQKDPAKHINKLENEGVKLQEVPSAELKNKSKLTTGSKCKQRGLCDGCSGCDSCGEWGCL
jgi:YHS domain-containing protein